MIVSFDRGEAGAPRERIVRVAAPVAVLLFIAAGVVAQSQINPVLAAKETAPMKPFVFVFRQGSARLSEADQRRRAVEVREWARRQNAEGRNLDPRMLDEESHRVEPGGRIGGNLPNRDGPLVAILFLEARDLAEAVSIAESHPGLRYGVTIEVRAWAPPAQTASRP